MGEGLGRIHKIYSVWQEISLFVMLSDLSPEARRAKGEAKHLFSSHMKVDVSHLLDMTEENVCA